MTNAKMEASLPVAECALCDTDTFNTEWREIRGKWLCDCCWFECDACGEDIPADDKAECDHYTVCKGCQDEGEWCRPCSVADHAYDESAWTDHSWW